jgi:hypothetical protein
MSTQRNAKIDSILASIDREADAGHCSNWASIDETRTSLIVTLADGTTRRYTIPVA